MAKKVPATPDPSTEEKIKEAARRLFTQKGYDAVKTRDIAAEADINLALLNYYFRSKEKLFDIIMMESMEEFMQGVSIIINDHATGVDEKLERLVDSYIDMLLRNPNLPMFVLTELKNNPDKFAANMNAKIAPARSHFAAQMREAMGPQNAPPLHMLHLFANIMGLIVFPFVGAPILKNIASVDQEEFKQLMLERKKLIPLWIKAMMGIKPK